MLKWEYAVLSSWWVEESRSEEYVTRIAYRHVWQPGDEVEDFAQGISANLGADGWELVTITTQSVSLLTADSPQGSNAYGSFPHHKLFFKRPAIDQEA
jgi:hypothetical protein